MTREKQGGTDDGRTGRRRRWSANKNGRTHTQYCTVSLSLCVSCVRLLLLVQYSVLFSLTCAAAVVVSFPRPLVYASVSGLQCTEAPSDVLFRRPAARRTR